MKRLLTFFHLTLAALLVAGLTPFAAAQTNRGSITGTVLDSTGAAVPGVKIIARNAETGITIEAVATDEGSYRLQQVPAGVYTLTATGQGFKTAEVTSIVVEVNTTTSRDIVLETGVVTETVTVSSEGALTVQLDTSDIGTVVKPRQVLELPLAAGGVGGFGIRSAEAFTFLTPGVLGPGTATDNGQNNDGSQNGGTFQSKFAGSQNFSNEVLLEGASTFRTENGSSFDETAPSIEAFQEFKVLTSNLSAEFGRTGGGVTSFAFRSGTNDFNGSAYDFFRNRVLNANRYFRNALGRNPDGTLVAPRTFSNFNNFGGTIGGPIFLPRFGEGGPRLYNGRNRSFFFVIYENSRQNFGGGSPVTLPTTAFRNGDFSSILDRGRQVGSDALGRPVLFGQIFDPATTRAVTVGANPDGTPITGFVRDPFPDNIIPASRFSRVAQNVLGFVPTPNLPGIVREGFPSENFLIGVSASPLNVQTYAVKLDHAISENSRLSGSYSYRQNVRVVDARSLPDAINRGNQDQIFTTRYLRLAHDQTFSSTILNHFNLGLNRTFSQNTSGSFGGNFPSQLGITGVAQSTFPDFNFGGRIQDIGFGLNNINIDNGLRLNDFVSVVAGNHSLRIGGDFRYQQYTPSNQGGTSGNFDFGSAQTAAPLLGGGVVTDSGFGFASFLLGQVGSAGINVRPNIVQFRTQYYAAFVQDDWKVRQNLTLNLGLRYDVDVPRRELANRYSGFDPALPNPGAGGRLGALAFADQTTQGLNSTRFADTYYKNIGPRVGFAYSPDRGGDGVLGKLLGGAGKTVFRGGFGIYYQALQYADFGEQASSGFNASADFNTGLSGLRSFDPTFNLDAGLPAIPVNRTPPFIDPSFLNLQNINYVARSHGRGGMITNYSFEMQRELSTDLVINVGYIGTQGHHLRSDLERLNTPDPRVLVLGSLLERNITDVTPADVAFAAARGIQIGSGTNLPFAGFTGNVADSLRPFPQYRGINSRDQIENSGNSTFNAGFVQIQRRFSQGLNLLASYTFSKTITDADSTLPINGTFSGGGIVQNPYDRKAEKAVSNQDIPHSVVITYIYELPFGEGRRFNSDSRFINKLVGGFQIGAVHRYQSGQPLSFGGGISIPIFGTDLSGRTRYSIRPGFTTDDILSEAARNGTFDPRATDARGVYFNRDVFFDQNRECTFNQTTQQFDRNSFFGCRLPTEPFQFGNIARTFGDVRSQAFFNEDINIVKRIQILEGFDAEFRTEFINVFNRTIFRRPNTFDINDTANFGRVFGQSNNPRIIQFALKLLF